MSCCKNTVYWVKKLCKYVYKSMVYRGFIPFNNMIVSACFIHED